MFRKLITLVMVMMLCLSTVACGGSTAATSPVETRNFASLQTAVQPTKLPDGRYPVQQGSYNDGDGAYSLFLLNANPSLFVATDLQMARLTDEEISAGQGSYLEIASGQPVLHLSEDFKIEYIHAVTETQTNPQTNQPQTVIVRRESSFWTPFAGAIAGQMVANMLFTPQYYVPPVYQPGSVLTGYGGYGNTYNQAVKQYETRYNAPPAAVKNRSQLRTTGRIRANQTPTKGNSSRTATKNRPTGSGFGASNLKRSGNSSQNGSQRKSSRFGSGRSSSSGRRSFSRRRR